MPFSLVIHSNHFTFFALDVSSVRELVTYILRAKTVAVCGEFGKPKQPHCTFLFRKWDVLRYRLLYKWFHSGSMLTCLLLHSYASLIWECVQTTQMQQMLFSFVNEYASDYVLMDIFSMWESLLKQTVKCSMWENVSPCVWDCQGFVVWQETKVKPAR